MDHDETGCQPPPERPILCINNCGFFGSAATMNMCSKCHKDLLMKEEQQAKIATSSITKGSSSNIEPLLINVQPITLEPKSITVEPPRDSGPEETTLEANPNPNPGPGPTRCNTCKKRVGLTGFKCRCGYLYCASHRYSDKHDCQFDYRNAGREAIAKANPVVKAEKLDKI